ncbi:carbohydrate ABC transporter permease [Populibacterium corticicola]|uniref:Carbohydrate ABC transporter permease n=1 Tax=Populibacterium corticicola TaxID=1812826 RepID=A0ABW5XHZ4_9MICO
MKKTADKTARVARRAVSGGLRLAPYLFLTPFVVLFLVFMIVPIFIALFKSFYSVQRSGLGFGGANESVFVGFDNYVQAFSNSEFVGSFGRVLLFAVIQVPVMLAFALLLALLFDSAVVRFKRFFQLSVFLPYAVPSVVAALLWGFLYQPKVSPIIDILNSLGINAQFLTPDTVMWSMINVVIWSVTGVNMIIIFSSLQAVPRDIYEAARIDGAGEVRTALQIKIPMISGAVLLTTLFSIIGTFQLFNEPTVLRSITSNISGAYSPNMAIYQATTLGGNANLGSAMAIILGIATFALSIIVSALTNGKKKGGR